MKRIIRSIGRTMAHWPVVGRPIRILIHLTRLPEFRENTLNQLGQLSANHEELARQLAGFEAELSASRDGIARFEAGLSESREGIARFEAGLSESREGFVRQVAGFEAQLSEMRQQMNGVYQAMERLDVTNARLSRFEQEQLPQLLETVADMNHRLTTDKRDIDNLVRSFPISLRDMKRKVVSLEGDIDGLHTTIDEKAEAIRSGFTEQLRQAIDEKAEAINTNFTEQLGQAVERLNTERQQVEDRLAQLLARNDSSSEEYNTLRQHLDALNQSTDYLLNRVEFVRREVMFEMRYGAGEAGKLDDVDPEIVEPEKVSAARKNGLKLNLGCGHIALDGYINVDRRKLPGVDIVADIDKLPLKKGEVSEIFSAHMLEHFPQEQLTRELLPYWIGLLKKGGTFRAVVPDAEAMVQNYVNGDYPYKDFREVIYGSQDYDGDFHYNMFTPASLKDLLKDAGLKDVELIESGRKNGACYEFEISGKK